jgi:hypothetical protein
MMNRSKQAEEEKLLLTELFADLDRTKKANLLQDASLWDFTRLFADLDRAKKTLLKSDKRLTRIEKKMLCLLLCLESPQERAIILNRTPKGIDVDLSRGLYCYIKKLVECDPDEKLQNWRQIIIWLEEKGYKVSSSHHNLELTPSSDTQVNRPDDGRANLTETQEKSLKNLEVDKRYTTLVGREKYITEVCDTLTDSNAPRIITIDGIGGVGKTALAREISIRLLKKGSFDSVIWESAKPEEFTVTGKRSVSTATINFDRLLEKIARQLNCLEVLSIQETQEKCDFLRHILDKHPYLVVIDNLETVEGYLDLVNNLESLFNYSKALLTSRHIVAGSRHVKSCRLEGLNRDDSLLFLRTYAEDRVRANEAIGAVDEEKLIEIHQLTGGLPLAMELVIGKLERGYRLDNVLSQLMTTNYRLLQNPASSDEDIYQQFYRFIYQDSWENLSENAQDLLLGIGEFSLNDGARTTKLFDFVELSRKDLDNAVAELVQLSLIKCETRENQEILFLHPLTYLFVQNDAS